MGITFAKLFQRLFSKREMRILMVRTRRPREKRARSTRVARADEIARWRDRDRVVAARATFFAIAPSWHGCGRFCFICSRGFG